MDKRAKNPLINKYHLQKVKENLEMNSKRQPMLPGQLEKQAKMLQKGSLNQNQKMQP